jgi:hypothetical protein
MDLAGDLEEDSRWREHKMVDWITIDLKARWRIVGICLKISEYIFC